MNAPVGRTIVFSFDGTGNEPDDIYECIAMAAHRGGRPVSHAVGNPRMKLYDLLRHRTAVPLHWIDQGRSRLEEWLGRNPGRERQAPEEGRATARRQRVVGG